MTNVESGYSSSAADQSARPAAGISLKEALLADRLRLSQHETRLLLEHIQSGFAEQFQMSMSTVGFDIEFHGRSIDLVFTVNRRNLPKENLIDTSRY